jgi:hypothetical protein
MSGRLDTLKDCRLGLNKIKEAKSIIESFASRVKHLAFIP